VATLAPDYVQQLRFRLTYADCDPAQLVYYATYYAWFERTSSEYWLGRGVRLDHVVKTHGAAFVSRASGCEYLGRAGLYDVLAVSMYFGAVGRRSFTMVFDVIRDGDGVRVATGFNTLVMVDASGAAVPIPEALRAMMPVRSGPSGWAPRRPVSES
jgi:YbgC/YbaW family acyl-CoA thioester hydrolase